MRDEDCKAKDKWDRALLDSEKGRGVGSNAAILLPEIEGQASGQKDGCKSHYREKVELPVLEKEPEAIANG